VLSVAKTRNNFFEIVIANKKHLYLIGNDPIERAREKGMIYV